MQSANELMRGSWTGRDSGRQRRKQIQDGSDAMCSANAKSIDDWPKVELYNDRYSPFSVVVLMLSCTILCFFLDYV